MKKIGINLLDVKRQNRKQILLLLKNSGAMSRKDIARLLQLTPAAVTIIVTEMIEQGIIIEKGNQEETDKRAGRKKILIDIAYDHKFVLGISFELDGIEIGICNLKGNIIDSHHIDISEIDIKDEVKTLNEINNKCIYLLWKNNINKEDILGLGAGIIGAVDIQNGISKNAYGIFKGEIQVKKLLEEYLGISVTIDNNVRTLAMAELDFNTDNKYNDIIFVKYGPGIGSAIVLNNKIYSGSSNNAGELGHTIANYKGDLCRCGKRGCLETVASEIVLLNKARIICKNKDITFNEIMNNYEQGNKRIIDIVDEAIKYLSLSLVNAFSMYDPQNIIFYGEAFNEKKFMDKFKEQFKEMSCIDEIDSYIRLSSIKSEYRFLGGVALALRDFFYKEGGIVK